MKAAVIGIGAVGSILARELKKTGHEVVLLGRTESHGFTISENHEDTYHPYVIENINTYPPDSFDVVFISTKATALKELSNVMMKLVHADTEIILCQNGMGFDEWFENSIPAVVYISGQKLEDRIEHFQDSKLIIDNQNYRYLDQLIDDLGQAQLEITKSNDFEKLRYEKLLINLGINTLTGLSKNTAKIFEIKSVTDVAHQLLEEGIAIINSSRQIIDPSVAGTALSVYES